jgi:hypothetical protein
VTITRPVYATREAVKNAIDGKFTARDEAQIDRNLEASAWTIEGFLNRKFYPQTGTRFFDWPPEERMGRAWRLWLFEDEVISVASLTAGGTAIAPSGYFLEPANSGPPYTHVEINLAAGTAFGVSTTHQRQIAITGVFGYAADETTAGAVAADIDGMATTLNVSDASLLGVGDILRIGTERMIVTNRAMVATTQSLVTGWSTASTADVTATVADGTKLHPGEVVIVDGERILVIDIAGNTITGKRAWDGTVLATHSTAAIYALRQLTVTRGDLGTTAAAHTNGTAIARHVVPGIVRQLAVAETIAGIESEQAGYADKMTGAGATERPTGGGAVSPLRAMAMQAVGRQNRGRAI